MLPQVTYGPYQRLLACSAYSPMFSLLACSAYSPMFSSIIDLTLPSLFLPLCLLAGCAMGCAFCFTGKMGLLGTLPAGTIEGC
jgi:hypothetical protein